MNTIIRKSAKLPSLLSTVACAMLLCSPCMSTTPAAMAQGSEATQEPVLGAWKWDNTKKDFTLRADGTAAQPGRSGKWVRVESGSSSPVYQINWDNGRFLDTLTLSEDGTQLTGQNQVNYKLLATRVGLPVAAALNSDSPSTLEYASYLDLFAMQFPRAREWMLKPLDRAVPAEVRETMLGIEAAVRLEAASAPRTSLEAYRHSLGSSRALISALDEREVMRRRNLHTGNEAGISDAWKSNWSERARTMDAAMLASFMRFHEAARLCPKRTGFAADHEIRKFVIPSASSTGVHEHAKTTPQASRVSAQPPIHSPEKIAEEPKQSSMVSNPAKPQHPHPVVHPHRRLPVRVN